MTKYFYLYIPVILYITGSILSLKEITNIVTIFWIISIGTNFYLLNKEHNAKIYFCYHIFLLVISLGIDSGLFFILSNLKITYELYLIIQLLLISIIYLISTIFINVKLNKESCTNGACPF